jgi:hypothetical protein
VVRVGQLSLIGRSQAADLTSWNSARKGENNIRLQQHFIAAV